MPSYWEKSPYTGRGSLILGEMPLYWEKSPYTGGGSLILGAIPSNWEQSPHTGSPPRGLLGRVVPTSPLPHPSHPLRTPRPSIPRASPLLLPLPAGLCSPQRLPSERAARRSELQPPSPPAAPPPPPRVAPQRRVVALPPPPRPSSVSRGGPEL